MYLNEPQKELLVETIRISLEYPRSIKAVMETVEPIRAKYPDVQMSDLFVETADYDGGIELVYYRYQSNPNYEKELAAYQKSKELRSDGLTNAEGEITETILDALKLLFAKE